MPPWRGWHKQWYKPGCRLGFEAEITIPECGRVCYETSAYPYAVTPGINQVLLLTMD